MPHPMTGLIDVLSAARDRCSTRKIRAACTMRDVRRRVEDIIDKAKEDPGLSPEQQEHLRKLWTLANEGRDHG